VNSVPNKTYKYLQKLNIITISGNLDKQICKATKSDIKSNPTMKFILDDIDNEALEWMGDLPFDRQITEEIYACHGTPKDDLIYLLEDVENGSPSLRSDSEIIELLGKGKSPIILCGHTHIPRCVELSTGQIVINPGSVGIQAYTDEEPNIHSMQNFSPMASYATIEKINSNWSISFHRVRYDVESSISQAKKRKRIDWVHYLKTGRKL